MTGLIINELKEKYGENTANRLLSYLDLVLERNEHINLTAVRDRDEAIVKHVLDSLSVCDLPEYIEAKTIIDVGTGAGFPGVPLATLYPEKRFVLVDSLLKRLRIIDEICEDLGISNIETVHGRAEDLARDAAHRERYDLCVSRAVAGFATLCEYCLPFVRVGGAFFAYKGPDAEREIEESGRCCEKLGGKLEGIFPMRSEDIGLSHNIVCVKKKRSTPSAYPRKAGTPQKEPLK